MALDFPSSPSEGQQFTGSNGASYRYTSGAWAPTVPGAGPPTTTDSISEGTTNLYFTNERVDDRTAALIQNGTGITWSYNDAAGTLTPTVTATVAAAALTKTDDTNVTMTLGGTPATALLQATSLALGWTGTLSAARGGFGANVSAANGVPLFATGAATFTSTTGTGNFVRAADPVLTGNPTAPTATAGDSDTSIATTAFVAGAVATAAGTVMSAEDNLLINGGMQVWQRGTTFSGLTAYAYTADRWGINPGSGTTVSVSQVAIAPGAGTSGEAEGTRWSAMQIQRTVTGSGSLFLDQSIEDVRSAAGQTVTISFDIYTAVATTNSFGWAVWQGFGTGGSPSTGVTSATTRFSTASATWERKSIAFAVPSISGKTLGTNNNSVADFMLEIPASYGNQVVQITNLDIRLGSVAPAQFLRRPAQEELALCQRYYQRHNSAQLQGYCNSGGAIIQDFSLPVSMRVAPTLNFANSTSSGATGPTGFAAFPSHVQWYLTATTTAAVWVKTDLLVDAEL